MFCSLGEEERTKFRKKKKKEIKGKKKEMNLIVAKSGLIGIKGILRHTTTWNIFCRT